MAINGSKGYLEHIDDPEVSAVNATAGAGVCWALSSDSSDTAFAKAVAVGKGLHYAGATAATNNNLIEFCSNDLIFSGQEGSSYAEILFQLDDVTNIAFNFGLNDDVQDTSNTLPIEVSSSTITANAATFLGFVFDTNMTNDELHCIWVDDSSLGMTDADSSVDGEAVRMKGMSPTAAKWLYMRIDVQDRGSGNGVKATFLATDHNGKSIVKEFNTSVDRDVALCYYLGVENRSASVHNAYIKHCNYKQSTADM